MNTSQATIDILRLARSENIGPKLFFKAINYFGNATTALKNIESFVLKSGREKAIKLFSEENAVKEISALNKIGAKILTFDSEHYPKLLLQLDNAPPILTYIGNPDLLNKQIIAVVGSRNASINGQTFANYIAKSIVKNNDIIIASGLARGIDTSAHKASKPNTIAVLAGGIDHIYPQENEKLYYQIIEEGGLIITENAIGAHPLSKHFPLRNRIIAGISIATIVIEAGNKSGAIITAKYCIEQGKEVFVAPGSPMDPRCEGSNNLIKEGANIILNPADVLDNLPSLLNVKNRLQEKVKPEYNTNHPILIEDDKDDNSKSKILNLLSSVPTSIEEIANYTNLSLQHLYLFLLELELEDKIIRLPNNNVVLKYNC